MEEIDEIMDGIMDDEIDAGDEDEILSESVKTQSPTQPALLSQRQQFLDEAAQEAEEMPEKKCSIEEMLGEKLITTPTPHEKKG